MQNGLCPHCHSAEVYRDQNALVKDGLKISLWENVILDYYVCTSCGYVESYISDYPKLMSIRTKWTKVPPPQA